MDTISIGNILWYVLDNQNGRTLIITKDIVEKHPYNIDRFCGAWEESTLYTSLEDGQFLLTAEEANRYFSDDTARVAYYQGAPWAWWLRDTGIKNHAAYVDKDGAISTHGYRVDCAWCGVRPAMWV